MTNLLVAMEGPSLGCVSEVRLVSYSDIKEALAAPYVGDFK